EAIRLPCTDRHPRHCAACRSVGQGAAVHRADTRGRAQREGRFELRRLSVPRIVRRDPAEGAEKGQRHVRTGQGAHADGALVAGATGRVRLCRQRLHRALVLHGIRRHALPRWQERGRVHRPGDLEDPRPDDRLRPVAVQPRQRGVLDCQVGAQA
ncbi:MAG: hypothetical protein AVDCRST_MAG71-2782, partial [uncultured Lysobacter sp.]